MIDQLYGDPLLSEWERRFVRSLAEFGWRADYTESQKQKLRQVYQQIRRARHV
jgi:hypothetical protein